MAAKRALYQAIVRNLGALGVPPLDIKISLLEMHRRIGGSAAGCRHPMVQPLRLQPRQLRGMGVIERKQRLAERSDLEGIVERDRLYFAMGHVVLPAVVKNPLAKKCGPLPGQASKRPAHYEFSYRSRTAASGCVSQCAAAPAVSDTGKYPVRDTRQTSVQ